MFILEDYDHARARGAHIYAEIAGYGSTCEAFHRVRMSDSPEEPARAISLALEEAKNGITVNVVNPSSIDEKELTLSEARRIRDARFPIGRPPTVEDVANAVAFFASDEAEYVTGQVVNVSGGWML